VLTGALWKWDIEAIDRKVDYLIQRGCFQPDAEAVGISEWDFLTCRKRAACRKFHKKSR
jgi:low affinity Fe/Cu permease